MHSCTVHNAPYSYVPRTAAPLLTTHASRPFPPHLPPIVTVLFFFMSWAAPAPTPPTPTPPIGDVESYLITPPTPVMSIPTSCSSSSKTPTFRYAASTGKVGKGRLCE